MWPFSIPYPRYSPADVGVNSIEEASGEKGTFDYIVVGGGTSGCALASRLSEDPAVSVLVIERGDVDLRWASRVPLISMDWNRKRGGIARSYEASVMPNLSSTVDGGQYLVQSGPVNYAIIQGHTLGGLSRVNAMLYTRGAPAEYDRWAKMGRKGWSFEDVMPYFLKSERHLSDNPASYHGRNGLWCTRTQEPESYFQCDSEIIKAAEQHGFPYFHDGVDPDLPVQACIKPNKTLDASGYRHSAFNAYLTPSIATARNDRLRICVNSVVKKIHIHYNEQGKLRAEGIFLGPDKYTSNDESTYFVKARREVILSAGTISSPQILQLSGVGPKAELAKHGIEVVKDLPGVGSFLKDHCSVYTTYNINKNDSFARLLTDILFVIFELLKYLIFGTGVFLGPIGEVLVFAHSSLLSDTAEIIKPDPSSEPPKIPDIELQPMAVGATGQLPENIKNNGLYSFLVSSLQPKSHGTVRLASSDPRANADVDLKFLTDPSDYEALRKGLRLSMQLAASARRNGYRIEECDVPKDDSDDSLDDFSRHHLRTTYHYSSTCRMAPEDDEQPGVVDDELMVHGFENLRVADCSIFPDILAAHLQAPAVMVGEKCADMIRHKWKNSW